LLKWLNILATPYIFIIESSNCEVFKLGLQDPFCWNNFLVQWWSVVGTVAWISWVKFLQVTMQIVSSRGNTEKVSVCSEGNPGCKWCK
jgi:hypothetical protein